MITDDYVSFETAKLLKEKWFEGENRDWYIMEGFIEEIGVDDGVDPTAHEDIFNNVIPAPTLQMATKWLREKHNIHINLDIHWLYFANALGWMYTIIKILENGVDYVESKGDENDKTFYLTYEEACEAGIRYVLENLI